MGRFRALMENSNIQIETEIDELLENLNEELCENIMSKTTTTSFQYNGGPTSSSSVTTDGNEDLVKAAAVVLGVGVAALGVKKLFQWAFDKNRRLQNMKQQIAELNIKLKYADGESADRIKDKIKTAMEKMEIIATKVKKAQALAQAKQKQQ